MGRGQGTDLFGQGGVRAGPRFFNVADPGIDFLERFFQGFDEFVDRLLAGGEIGAGAFLEFLESGARQFQERLVVALQ